MFARAFWALSRQNGAFCTYGLKAVRVHTLHLRGFEGTVGSTNNAAGCGPKRDGYEGPARLNHEISKRTVFPSPQSRSLKFAQEDRNSGLEGRGRRFPRSHTVG